jgi:hypothetical protein
MASYLDYLFPPQQQQPVAGLLGEEDIRRNQQMAQRAGLLNTGLGIIAASGPSRMPQGNILQSIAPGLMAGQQAYQGTLAQQQSQLAERARALQEESVVLPEGGTLVGKRTGATIAQGAPKTQAVPGKIAEFLAARDQGLIPATMTLSQYQNMSTPKTIIDMTGGQKGFDNEMSLKKSFAAEPTYKAFNEMQAAYGQINDSLKSASPAGDLAAATKFMKLLDPGSVVRESELGMAMAASGMLDRATNYAKMRIDGTKLTETQRKDFKDLSEALFSTAVGAYNSKRGEFEEMGSAYGLDAKRALGAPAKMPKAAGMPSQNDIDAEIERRRKARQ